MRCLRCLVPLKPKEVVAHLQFFHSGTQDPRWDCGRCDYECGSLGLAVAHCLLEGHSLLNLRNANALVSRELLGQATLLWAVQSTTPASSSSSSSSASSSSTSVPVISCRKPAPVSEAIRKPLFVATKKADANAKPTLPLTPQSSPEPPQSQKSDALPSKQPNPALTSEQLRDAKMSEEEEEPEETTIKASPTSSKMRGEEEEHEEDAVDVVSPDAEQSEQSVVSEQTEETEQTVMSSGRRRRLLTCAQCGSSICASSRGKLAQHVLYCIKIKPWGCSACRFVTSQRHNLLRHFQSRFKLCRSASIVVRDKETSEASVRAGLRLCFPKENVQWNGLQHAEGM